jgi:hypothetical protein
LLVNALRKSFKSELFIRRSGPEQGQGKTKLCESDLDSVTLYTAGVRFLEILADA